MPLSAADDLFFAVQSALAGEYSLIRELGRGGMGVVYLATEVRLAREVAVKVLPPHLAADAERREQFVREAQTAARLSHPNIVPIHRVGEAGDVVFFVMTYVPGRTLGEHLRTRGPLTPQHAASVLREVAWALTYAHAAGLVHRDVKPDNILLEDGSGRAMVTDFGIARGFAADVGSGHGAIAGTAHYMSPEQAAGEPVDGRSDIYSLGVVAYYALSGQLPFDGATTAQILARHLGGALDPLRIAAPTVPHKLAHAVECCLARDPAHRFQRASELADALGNAVEPSREIAPAIRVWLATENRNRGARILGGVYGTMLLGVGLFRATGSWVPAVVSPVIVLGLVIGLPTLFSTRRLLRAGYTLSDLRDGLRLDWVRRREELAYELGTRWSGGMRPAAAGVALAALGVWGIVAMQDLSLATTPFQAFFGAVTVGGGVGLAVIACIRHVQRRMLSDRKPLMLRFWNGSWGARFAGLAGFRLKRSVIAPPGHQMTELALGRASDALFESLPRATRKQLGDVPATVRRLESEATRLRDHLQEIETSIGALETDARRPTPARAAEGSRAAAPGGEHVELRADLRRLRDDANTKLAATVAALESIRLGLLRVQFGAAPVESVTAVLEAARAASHDISLVADAREEVERVLGAGRLAEFACELPPRLAVSQAPPSPPRRSGP